MEENMLHIIAYKDQTGKDFNGLPWLQIASDDLEYAKYQASTMEVKYDLKNVVLAGCLDEELPETVTWEFIYEHQIF